MWLNGVLKWKDCYCVGSHVFDYFEVELLQPIFDMAKGTVVSKIRINYMDGTILFEDFNITIKLVVGMIST